MTKKVLCIMTVIFSLIFIAITSYYFAKNKAEDIVNSFNGNISPLIVQFVFLKDDAVCTPYWSFRGEYEDYMTGATFDIEISLLGKVIHQPPYTKANQEPKQTNKLQTVSDQVEGIERSSPLLTFVSHFSHSAN